MSSVPTLGSIVQQFQGSDVVIRSGTPRNGITPGKAAIKAVIVDRAFRCTICPYRTQSSSQLVLHVRTKHH